MLEPPRYFDFHRLEEGIREQLGFNLHEVRTAQGLTQSQAARAMGMSLSQWKKYELGREVMKIDTAVSWCLLSGTALKRLFAGTAYDTGAMRSDEQIIFDRLSLPISAMTLEQYRHLVTAIEAIFSLPPSVLFVPTQDEQRYSVSFDNSGMRKEYFALIASWLHTYRQSVHLSQGQFCEVLGISQSAYQKYESGHTPTRFSIVFGARFALAARCNPQCVVRTSRIGRAREFQDERMEHFLQLMKRIGMAKLDFVESIVFNMIRHVGLMKPVSGVRCPGD